MPYSSENKKGKKKSAARVGGEAAGAVAGGLVLVAGVILVGGVLLVGGLLLSGFWSEKKEEEQRNPDPIIETYSITRDIKRRVAAEAQRNSAMVDVPEGSACLVCLAKERQMLFNSCGHVCMCEACVVAAAGGANAREDVPVVLRCPLCRREGTVRRIYG